MITRRRLPVFLSFLMLFLACLALFAVHLDYPLVRRSVTALRVLDHLRNPAISLWDIVTREEFYLSKPIGFPFAAWPLSYLLPLPAALSLSALLANLVLAGVFFFILRDASIRVFGNDRGVHLAWWLTVLNPLFIAGAYNASPDALFACFFLGAQYFYGKVFQDGRRRNKFAFVCMTAGACMIKVTGPLILAPVLTRLLAALAAKRRALRMELWAILAVLFVLAALAGMNPLVNYSAYIKNYLLNPNVWSEIRERWNPLHNAASVGVFLVLCYSFAFALPRPGFWRNLRDRLPEFEISFFFFGFLILAHYQTYWDLRQLLPVLPALTLMICGALRSSLPRWKPVACIGLLIALNLAMNTPVSHWIFKRFDYWPYDRHLDSFRSAQMVELGEKLRTLESMADANPGLSHIMITYYYDEHVLELLRRAGHLRKDIAVRHHYSCEEIDSSKRAIILHYWWSHVPLAHCLRILGSQGYEVVPSTVATETDLLLKSFHP